MGESCVSGMLRRRGALPAVSAAVVACVAVMVLPSFFGTAYTLYPLCFVDIGDSDTDLAYIDEDTWGPVVENTGSNWGGLGEDNCRVVWASEDDAPDAYVTLQLPVDFRGSIQYMEMSVLDGQADDSFTVEVYDPLWDDGAGAWVLIYDYSSAFVDENDDGVDDEIWVTHTVYFVDLVSWVCVTHGCCWYLENGLELRITATGPPWSGINMFGQLGVDWIELFGYGKPM